jgi:FtsH-binding integral membrane protein
MRVREIVWSRAMAESRQRIEHPNRKKAASKITRLLVIVLLLGSAGLVAIVSVGGWAAIAGAKPLQVAYILLYLVLAFFVARWSRGVLPLIAALAIVLLIFAAVSAPAWFDRSQTGFTDPALPSDLLGLITALLVPVQILLIAVAMSGFRQAWNVEVEHGSDEDTSGRDGRGPRREPEREPQPQQPESGGPSPAPA